MEPYAGVDYHLIICPLQSRPNTFTMGNPMPESTLSPSQGQIRALSGRYDNPFPSQFLAPIDFLQNTGLV
jgi:hypothetical protein